MSQDQNRITPTVHAAEKTAGWLCVGLSVIDGQGRAPCNLFRNVGPHRYVLLAQKGLPIDRSLPEKLADRGQGNLYIQEEEAPLYFKYLREVCLKIVADPHISAPKKAAVVYNSCRDVLQRIHEDPRASFISTAVDAIAPTMDLIISDSVATKCLFKLTSYDQSTYTHSTNVGIFSIALARHFYGHESVGKLKAFGAGFFLHDMGKSMIPLEILNKPGPLTPAERVIVNRHPEDGFNILQKCGVMTEEIKIITLQHHERDDGTGYPNGLKRREIHPYARICRLADIYEALTAERPYKKARTSFAALKLMKEEVVSDIDQELFETFLKLFKR